MHQLLRSVGLVLVLATMAACINVSTVIKVNPDGSGFIEETVLISRVIMEQFGGMIQGMAEGFGVEDQAGFEFPGLFDEEQLEAKAAQYGEGVEYVSGEELVSETGEGYRAIYHFSDIGLLEVNQNPSDELGEGPLSSLGSIPKQFLKFQFQPGVPNTLIVNLPKTSQETASFDAETNEDSFTFDETNTQLNPQMLAMFQSFFKDMRIAMSLDIQGTIINTNATHREGTEIRILELNAGELLEDPNWITHFQDATLTSFEDAQKLLRELPGIKLELNDKLVIQYQ